MEWPEGRIRDLAGRVRGATDPAARDALRARLRAVEGRIRRLVGPTGPAATRMGKRRAFPALPGLGPNACRALAVLAEAGGVLKRHQFAELGRMAFRAAALDEATAELAGLGLVEVEAVERPWRALHGHTVTVRATFYRITDRGRALVEGARCDDGEGVDGRPAEGAGSPDARAPRVGRVGRAAGAADRPVPPPGRTDRPQPGGARPAAAHAVPARAAGRQAG